MERAFCQAGQVRSVLNCGLMKSASMHLSFAVSLLFGWRLQFSIRSLLALVVAVAIPCSWLTVERRWTTSNP